MSPKRPSEAANLFAAAGMEQDAPHPLPDRLRPRVLSDVVGQDHILGPDGALTRMLATRTLGSLIFWGPPGTGKTVKLTVALETAPDTGRNEIVLTGRSPLQGAKVANISPAVADELHLDSDTEGVVVTDLADGGAAAGVGFQKGDIITSVNSQKIAKTSDLEKATRDQVRIWRITVVRGGQQINVTLGG